MYQPRFYDWCALNWKVELVLHLASPVHFSLSFFARRIPGSSLFVPVGGSVRPRGAFCGALKEFRRDLSNHALKGARLVFKASLEFSLMLTLLQEQVPL